MKCVYSIDDDNKSSNQFYIKTEKRAGGQDSREAERASEGESASVGGERK